MADNLIELAKCYMEKGKNTRAFFALAVKAVEQLKFLAASAAKIAQRLDAWDGQGTMDVTIHERNKY